MHMFRGLPNYTKVRFSTVTCIWCLISLLGVINLHSLGMISQIVIVYPYCLYLLSCIWIVISENVQYHTGDASLLY